MISVYMSARVEVLSKAASGIATVPGVRVWPFVADASDIIRMNMKPGKGGGIGRRKAIEIRRRKARGTGPPGVIGSGPVQGVGIVWYRREDYARLKQMFPDGDRLPETFEGWCEKLKEVRDVLTSRGILLRRVYLDPENFPAWCEARGLKMDAQARTKYAMETPGEPLP
jgi:hypothetical protein